ncbi:MAG: hypothetical protein ACRETA_12720 [Gammaproteobacteria bacterium]
MDYVLFSDSAVKAATHNQQCYVTISRGKKRIHIFTGDKAELRENITRSRNRPLAFNAVAERQDARTVTVRDIQAFLRRPSVRRETENRRASKSIGMSV